MEGHPYVRYLTRLCRLGSHSGESSVVQKLVLEGHCGRQDSALSYGMGDRKLLGEGRVRRGPVGVKTGQQPQTHTNKKFREEECMMWILILFCFVAGCAMNAILSVLLVGFMPTMTLNTP